MQMVYQQWERCAWQASAPSHQFWSKYALIHVWDQVLPFLCIHCAAGGPIFYLATVITLDFPAFVIRQPLLLLTGQYWFVDFTNLSWLECLNDISLNVYVYKCEHLNSLSHKLPLESWDYQVWENIPGTLRRYCNLYYYCNYILQIHEKTVSRREN